MSLAGLENIFLEVITASRDAGILALAIGGLLLFAGRKITPHWRHLLWMLVALRLMLPVLPESPSSWQRWMPEETSVPQKVMPVVEHDLPNDLPKVVPYQPAEGVSFQRPVIVIEVKAIPLSWPSVLALVWITGVAGFLTLLCICTFRFRRKLRRLSFPDHEKIAPLRELLEQLCRETGIRRLPALRITEAVASPALTGLLRPEILIPPSAIEQLKMSELRLVLLHELGHQQRRDLWTSWLLSLLHVVHWFNPLVWWAFYRTRHESERATDAWVLQKTGADRAADYGEALLRLLEGGIKTKIPLPDIVGILESPRDLRSRIIAIGRFTGKRSRWAVAFSVALICGIVAVGFTQAPKDKIEKIPAAEKPEEVKKAIKAKPKKNRYFSVKTSKPLIALTFDDGPVKANTTRLLDMLKERNAKATFFVVGEMARNNPQLLRRMVDEGHEIGNHTVKHGNLSRLSDQKLIEELRNAHVIIKEAAGVDVKIFRPPGGATTKWQRELIMKEFGYPTIMWSVDPVDWNKPGVEVVTKRLVDGAAPGGILLVHDLHKQTVDAIPAVLDQLLEKGYKFVTVSGLITADESPDKEAPKATKAPGKAIEFIVKDSDGNTVPDADIDIFLPYETPTLPIQFKVKTDLDGKASIPINPNWGKKGNQKGFLLNAFSQKEGLGKGARTYINTPVKYVGGFASENPVVINLSKGKAIRIRVTDNTGKPISGIRMRANAFWRMSDKTDPPCMGEIPLLKDGFWNAKTDSDGLCEIEELPEGTLVHLDHDEEKYAHVEGRGDITKFLSVNDSKETTEIQLIPSASISGTVKLPDGTAVEDGLIRTQAAFIGGAIESSMSNDGSFKLNRLRPADYELHVVLPDAIKYKWWAPITYSNGLKEGESRSGIKIQLKPAASISGTVKFPDGKSIGGARIRIKASGWREAFDEIQLDANGAFEFRGLTSGTNQIAVSLLGPEKENWASSITKIEALKDGESRGGLEVILNRGVLVTGKVTFGDTGKPVSGISVFSQGDTTEQAETNEEGLYRMRLTTGRNPVTISWDRPKGYSAPEDRNIVVEGKAGDTATADFALPRDIIIRGRVLGPDKTPLEGATVICVKEGNYYITEKVISDENGEFEFELPSITKEATFFATLGTLRTKKKIEVKKGEALVLSLEKNNKAILDGRVVDGEGNPIKWVKVVSSIPKILPHSVEKRTNTEGEYTLDTLFLKDKFRLNASKGGYGLNSIDIDLSKGYEKNLPDIVIERADKTVSGKVVDSKGNPVPNAWVDVDGSHQPLEFHKQDYQADKDGNFKMSGLADPWFWVIGGLEKEGAKEITGRVRAGGNQSDVVLVLSEKSNSGKQTPPEKQVGQEAPLLKVKTWLNSEKLPESHKGKIRLIKFTGGRQAFWGLMKPLPLLLELQEKYADEKDFEIIVVHQSWPEEEVRKVLHEKFPDLKIPVTLEPEEGGMLKALSSKPWHTVIIDRDGKIAFQSFWQEEKVKKKIAELLKKK